MHVLIVEELLNSEERDTVYCPTCDSCGESGCCPPEKCLAKIIKYANCPYGNYYLKELLVARDFQDWILDTVSNRGISSKEIHRKWEEIWDKHFYE